jgi:uncharacterized protein (TIGR00299 family) protein
MILWLNPTSGLSGDMLLGALLDLGAPLDAVRDALDPLGLPGWSVAAEPTARGGLRATRALVRIADDAEHRSAATLLDLVARVERAPVAAVATAAIRALAETEASIHGVPVADVQLHELGGLDTVVDTVGVAAAVDALGITAVHSAPIALGTGSIDSAHGLLPVPAPATLALLTGADVYGIGAVGETVTPTGAALLRALGCRYEPAPPMSVRAVGYGAGTRDPVERPNVLGAVLGAPRAPVGERESLVLLETTVDDVTGEEIGTALERVLAAGALDAWALPATGKKGRPALVVSVLARPPEVDTVLDVLARFTGTLGVRLMDVERATLPRRTVEVTLDGQRIRVKVGPHRAKPEHDDVVIAALALGQSPATVAARALAAAAENGAR